MDQEQTSGAKAPARGGLELCAYCGKSLGLTRDHVIPQCMFTRPLPQDMVTVPACRACQEAKSNNDNFLRDLLVMDIFGSNHQVADTLLKGKVKRSFDRNSSVVAEAFVAKAQAKPFYTTAGVYLGRALMVDLEERQFTDAISTIVRGLYYHVRRKRLPDDCVFDIRRHFPWDFPQIVRDLGRFLVNGPHSIGGDVFQCWYGFAVDADAESVWLLAFYNAVVFVVFTNAPEHAPDVNSSVTLPAP